MPRIFTTLLSLLLPLVLGAQTAYIEYWPDGTKKMAGWMKKGKRDSSWTFYDSTGVRRSAGPFRNDQRCGEWSEWSAQGRLLQRMDYGKPGEAAGGKPVRYTLLHINGKPKEYFCSIDSAGIDEQLVRWDISGRLVSTSLKLLPNERHITEIRTDYRSDSERCVTYLSDANASADSCFSPQGKLLFARHDNHAWSYYANGRLAFYDSHDSTVHYNENGQPVTQLVRFHLASEEQAIAEAKKGIYLPLRVSREWDATGALVEEEYAYVPFSSCDTVRRYDENRRLIASGQLDKKRRETGKWEYRYHDGGLQAVAGFSKGVRRGAFKTYDANGVLVSEGHEHRPAKEKKAGEGK